MFDPPLTRDGGAGEKGGGGLSSLPGGDLSRSIVPSTGSVTDTPTPAPASTSTPSSSTSTSVSLPAARVATLPQGRGSHAKGGPHGSAPASTPAHPASLPAASAAAPAQVGGGRAKGTSKKCVKKSFEEIMEESKTKRNILEICIQRPPRPNPAVVDEAEASSTNNQDNTLSYDDFADFLFDELSVKPEDCLTFNYSFSNYTNKEVGFKPQVDITPYVGNYSFRGHNVLTRKLCSKSVRVSFKNVPLCVSDHELINIIECYGEVTDSVVSYQAATNPKARGIVNMNTRFIEMVLSEKKLPNFFWLEGPLPSDPGCRVTVTYPGQTPQCYNCLRIGNLCPANGRGKLCVQQKTERLRMDLYINTLRMRDSFSTLKAQYTATNPLPGQQVDRMVVEEQDIVIEDEEEKDRTIAGLRSRLVFEEELRQEQEEKYRVLEQRLNQVRQEQEQEDIRKEKQELDRLRKVHEKYKEQKAFSEEQERRRTEQEGRVQEEHMEEEFQVIEGEESKLEREECESVLIATLLEGENFEEAATAFAEVCHLPDFLQVTDSDGGVSISAPRYFLSSVETVVDSTTRSEYDNLRESILKKVLLRKLCEVETGVERQGSTIFRRTRALSSSKRKAEDNHAGSPARSRLEGSSSTPEYHDCPTPPPPGYSPEPSQVISLLPPAPGKLPQPLGSDRTLSATTQPKAGQQQGVDPLQPQARLPPRPPTPGKSQVRPEEQEVAGLAESHTTSV